MNGSLYEKGVSLQSANVEKLRFDNSIVELHTAPPDHRLDLTGELAHPEDYYGSLLVDHVVRFGQTFTPLIGVYDGQRYGPWEPDKLPQLGVFVAEHDSHEAGALVRKINELAAKFVADKRLYDDTEACKVYYDLAKAGYDFLRKYEQTYSDSPFKGGTPVSLERAGLVATRLAFGYEKDAIIPGEVRVVTKRTQLKGEPNTSLTVTVSWRDSDVKRRLGDKQIILNDFVNPASGASTAALLLATKVKDALPRRAEHRSIMATQQGILFNREALLAMGVEPVFYTLGECNEMNEHYYLIGKPVGDAGHALRHALPGWYEQELKPHG